MNQTILKLDFLPNHYKRGTHSTALKSVKGREDFFSTLMKLMSPIQKKSYHKFTEPSQAGLSPKKGYSFYLESLRKGLLAKGKPLHNISLNSEDLPILKKLLYQCGFSQENAERFLKELLENNPHREINLSQFFLKIAELGPPKTKIDQPIILELSAIPYIESVLRDFGLTPKELGHAFDAARVEGGGLDLKKFAIKLKAISHKGIPLQNKVKLDQFVKAIEEVVSRSAVSKSAARVEGGGLDLKKFAIKLKAISHKGIPPQNKVKLDQFVKAIEEVVSRSAVSKSAARVEGGGGNQIKPDHNLAHQISIKLEGLGIQIPDKGKGGQISIKDFIAALEQITGRAGKGNQLPTDVKATIDQILERVVIANEKDGAISSQPSFSKLRLTNLHSKEEIGKTGKPVERESLLSPLKEKGNINNKNGQQKVESPFPSKEAKLFSGLDADQARPPRLSRALREDGGQGLKKGTTEEGNLVKSETRIMDIPHGIKGSTFSEAINTVKQHPEPVRNLLPAYLIDQVGKQISRSILRGERVIRLQLRPPELGVLKVEMDIKDNILKLGMITENSSVKQLLLSNAHELRQALVDQGVKLERLDVQINYDSGQSLANSKEGLKEGQGQGLNGMPFRTEDDTEIPILGLQNMATGDHLLDLMA